jgi:hypothetical protein
MPPAFLQQELFQGRALQLLLGAAAAVVVFTLVADGAGLGVHADFEQLLGARLDQSDIRHDAQYVADFVG